MRLRSVMLAAGAAVMMAGAAQAGGGHKVYPYHAKHHFCPAGLQPVQISGVICCGTPNQKMSYSSMMHTGAAKKRVRVKTAKADCPIGQKGCNYD